jgi:hypothetical protein
MLLHSINPYRTTVVYTSYIEILVKPGILTLYIYEPMFGNAVIHVFIYTAQFLNYEWIINAILCHNCV